MAISTETQAWLDDLEKTGAVSAEGLAALKVAAGNDKVNEYIKGSVLRQSDYSKNMGELKKAQDDFSKFQQELATKEAAVTKYQQELGVWKEGADKNYQKALEAREAADKKVTAAMGRLNRVAATYGLPPEELEGLESVVPDVKTPVTAQAFDSEAFKREIYKEIGSKVTQAGQLDALILDISEQHKELFGTRLPDPSGLINDALASGKKLTDFYREKYKVADKEREIAETAFNARVNAEVETRTAKILSEANLGNRVTPGLRDDLHGSPVLREGGVPFPKADQTEGGGVSAAIAAFQSGRFRGGVDHTSK